MAFFRPGETRQLPGNVTTLQWIGARSPAAIEQSLGFHSGRLADGYAIALLKEPLAPADFEFDGLTLRSGGKLGLPGASDAADALRPRVHDMMKQEYGDAGYRQMQLRALASVKLSGDERIAKVVPVTRHAGGMAPNVQYPPGAGGLQWKILEPGKRFLIAAVVDPSGLATTPSFSVHIGAGAPYENRAKLMNYLRMA